MSSERPELDLWPLSPAQLGIWTGHQLSGDASLYNVSECLEFTGQVDRGALLRAIDQALQECAALHMCFSDQDEGIVQRLLAPSSTYDLVDWRQQAQPELALRRYAAQAQQESFALQHGPIFRSVVFELADDHYYWYLQCHHIALDGFGFHLLGQRIARIYRALLRSRECPTLTSVADFRAVIHEDVAYSRSLDCDRDRIFWLRYLEDRPEPQSFAEHRPQAADRPLRSEGQFSRDLMVGVTELARTVGSGWPQVMIAAFADFFSRHRGLAEVTLGLPMAGRTGALRARVPAMLMNIVPLRVPVARLGDPQALVAHVATTMRLQGPHLRYRHEQLRADLRTRDGEAALFGPTVNILPFTDPPATLGLEMRRLRISAGPVEDLSLSIVANPLGTHGDFELDLHPLFGACPSTMADAWRTALDDFLGRSATAGPRKPSCGKLGGPKSSDEKFSAIVGEHPQAVALEQGGKAWSYADLDALVEHLAQTLADREIMPGDSALLLFERSAAVVVAMLACQRLGLRMVPLDARGSRARSREIAAELPEAWLLAGPELRSTAEQLSSRVLTYEIPAAGCLPRTRRKFQVDEHRGAYLMYTSGSTGRPNGVVVSRAALAHFIEAAGESYGPTLGDRVLQFAPLHFDACIEEIFLSLCAGATLVLRDDSDLDSIAGFVDNCRRRRISVLGLPTAFFHELCYAVDRQQLKLPAELHTIIIGGEALDPGALTSLWPLGATGLEVVNTYGPTEATVVSTAVRLSETSPPDAVNSVGGPLPGVSVAIVDAAGEVVPRGEVGELCIVGPMLASGYLHRPQLTHQRFVVLPTVPGRPRAYRSGDQASYDDHGSIKFHGRIDDEVKVSGFRIHPRELEAVLTRHAEVVEACVLVRADGDHRKYFVAFIVGQPNAAELRTWVADALLPAAVPRQILTVPRLPRNRNGKIDRQALAERWDEGSSTTANIRDPKHNSATPEQQQLAKIWSSVLGVEVSAAQADFFALGGASLHALQVATRTSAWLGREITAQEVMRYPNLGEFLDHVAGGDSRTADRGVPLADMARDGRWQGRPGWSPEGPRFDDASAILLTGATGFLGGQILRTCLAQGEAPIYCLVRGGPKAQAEARLRAQLEGQGGVAPELLQAFSARVQVVVGDLGRPDLGLEKPVWMQLAGSCDAIVHAAAEVNLMLDYRRLRASNVEALRSLIALAGEQRPKSLHYLSTLAVAPGLEQCRQIDETWISPGPHLRDGYVQTKSVAEQLLKSAIADGLQATIYRLGRVCPGRDQTAVHAGDLFVRVLAAGLRVGCLPRWPVHEDWVPVDFAARAIMAIVRHGQRAQAQPIFHVGVGARFAWPELFQMAAALGSPVTWMEPHPWRDELRQRVEISGHSEDRSTVALLSGIPEAALRADVRIGLGAASELQFRAELDRLGMEPPHIDEDYFRALLLRWHAAGLLPKGPPGEDSP